MNRREFLNKILISACSVSVFAMGISCHKDDPYSIDQSKCTGCGDCVSSCPNDAITLYGGKASISSSDCVGCGKCVSHCKEGAISS
ncbi:MULTISPECIES: indolepyruvate ferredoxin oxidoreductase subunit alpha [unclassified Saccharicrinis]|uniref:indolepyruvate ferredoxin oxidoreductase subunit alpha n=1 Tax=unclassified Saccharicrinis TaxID=2646859 RepID=UPI003D340A28